MYNYSYDPISHCTQACNMTESNVVTYVVPAVATVTETHHGGTSQ